MGKKDDLTPEEAEKLGTAMGDASRRGDEEALAKLAAQVPRDEHGQYRIP